MATKTPKTTPKQAARKPRTLAEMPLPAAPPRPKSIGDRVYESFDLILAAFASGDSFEQIGAAMEPPLMGVQVRLAIHNDKAMITRLNAIKEHRAEHFIEVAAEQLNKGGVDGMTAKERAQIAISLAEKTAPTTYGNKIAVTGGDGGPLAVSVKLTPTDAYKKMLGLA